MTKKDSLNVKLKTDSLNILDTAGHIGVSSIESANVKGINKFSIDTSNLLKFSAKENVEYAKKWIDSYSVMKQSLPSEELLLLAKVNLVDKALSWFNCYINVKFATFEEFVKFFTEKYCVDKGP